jgi:hypothetical protein
MSVSLQQPLPAISFSANPIEVKIVSDNYLQAAGIKAVNMLQISDAINPGSTLTLSWNDVTITLTAVPGAMDDEGLVFPSGDGSENYARGLIPFMEQIYLLNRDFDITSDWQQMFFTAKKPGPEFNMAAAAIDNSRLTNKIPGATLIPQPWFAHHLEVWIKQRGQSQYLQAYNYNIELDEPRTGLSVIDIGPEILHNFLESDLPILTGTSITFCAKSIGDYFIRYGQYYGDIPTVKRLLKSDICAIAYGGLSLYGATQRNLLSELCPDPTDTKFNRFMRQGSITKAVTQDQPEWLYYINTSNAPQLLTAEITVTYTQGNDFTFTFAATAPLPIYGKCQLPAGYAQLGIYERQPNRKPIYYTVRLRTDAFFVTTAYTYVVDYTWREWPRYFVYQNAYGAFQTIGTIGKAQPGADRKKEDARMDKAAGNVPIDGDFLEYNITLQQKGTVNIGYDRANTRSTLLLDDFLTSNKKFIYEKGRLIPIGISSTEIKRAEDGVDLFASSFDYFYSYEDPRYTEEPGMPDDDINDLLNGAGTPILPLTPGDGSGDPNENFTGIIDTGINNDGSFIDV